MSRINWMVAALMAVGVVGCAQCDTCDDFPAPCVGPNCGPGQGGARYTGGLGYLEPPIDQGPGTMLSAPPGQADQSHGDRGPDQGPAPSQAPAGESPAPADATPPTPPMPDASAPR